MKFKQVILVCTFLLIVLLLANVCADEEILTGDNLTVSDVQDDFVCELSLQEDIPQTGDADTEIQKEKN